MSTASAPARYRTSCGAFAPAVLAPTAWLVLIAIAGSGEPPVPVTGDRDALSAVRDAQRHLAEADWPHGRFEFHSVHRRFRTSEGEEILGSWHGVKGTVEWRDDSVRYWYDHGLGGADQPEATPESARIDLERDGRINLSSAENLVHYLPGVKRAVIVRPRPDGSRQLPAMEVRPGKNWYGPGNPGPGSPLLWADVLDLEKLRGRLRGVEVRRDGALVRIERQSLSGRVWEMTADLSRGGNIVSFEITGEEDQPHQAARPPMERLAETTWLPAGNGRFYPAQMKWELTLYESADEWQRYVGEWEITEFDLEYEPPPSRFKVEALEMAIGTEVEYRNVEGRTVRQAVVGSADYDADELTLKSLADDLKKSGFGGGGENDR